MRSVAIGLIVAILASVGWLVLHRTDRPAPRLVPQPAAPTAVPTELPAPIIPPELAEPVVALPPEPVPPPAPAAQLPKGKMVTVVLSEPPASRYGSAQATESDRHYANLVRELSHGRAHYDANLGRAARELVYQSTEFGEVVPSEVRQFAIASAGALAADSTFQQIRTNDEGQGPLKQAISAVVNDREGEDGPLRVGVGEVYRHGLPLPRHIGVVGTRVGVSIEPLALRLAAGATWQVRGRLVAAWRDLKALVLQPDGSESEAAVTVMGDALTLDVVAGPHAGALDVQLVGEGPSGPGKVVQLRAYIDQNPPDRLTAAVPADESAQTTFAAAEAYAFQLLNADRARHRKPALLWDSQLAQIARAHSDDMRDHHFFGHQSARTGLPADRLKAAHYLTSSNAENVAHNGTVFEAQEGLMHSLGHRRNILSAEPTRIGIGIALVIEGKRRRLWLTQLFAKPALTWTASEVEAAIRLRVAQARAAQGLSALLVDDELAATARQAAQEAKPDEFAGTATVAVAQAKDRNLFEGSLNASAALTADPDKMALPSVTLHPEARKLAIGAAKLADSAQFAIVILVLQ